MESKKGEGSCFRIVLPCMISTVRREGGRQEGRAPAGKGRPRGHGNILVVEDNENNRRMIATILERLGYTVHSEELGEGGVSAALGMKFDLILMDIRLPDMSGVEAMKRIREGCSSWVPVIALTAYAMKGDEEKFKAEGFDGYISKPVDVENARDTIENLLKK